MDFIISNTMSNKQFQPPLSVYHLLLPSDGRLGHPQHNDSDASPPGRGCFCQSEIFLSNQKTDFGFFAPVLINILELSDNTQGYLIGNLKHRKVSSGYGGYGPPLGYNRWEGSIVVFTTCKTPMHHMEVFQSGSVFLYFSFNRVGYGYPNYHQASYHQDPYPHRR